MVDELSGLTSAVDEPIAPLAFAIRTVWVAIQLALVIYLGQPGALFFYQLF